MPHCLALHSLTLPPLARVDLPALGGDVGPVAVRHLAVAATRGALPVAAQRLPVVLPVRIEERRAPNVGVVG